MKNKGVGQNDLTSITIFFTCYANGLERGVHVFMVYGKDNELLGNKKVVVE